MIQLTARSIKTFESSLNTISITRVRGQKGQSASMKEIQSFFSARQLCVFNYVRVINRSKQGRSRSYRRRSLPHSLSLSLSPLVVITLYLTSTLIHRRGFLILLDVTVLSSLEPRCRDPHAMRDKSNVGQWIMGGDNEKMKRTV